MVSVKSHMFLKYSVFVAFKSRVILGLLLVTYFHIFGFLKFSKNIFEVSKASAIFSVPSRTTEESSTRRNVWLHRFPPGGKLNGSFIPFSLI